MDTEPNRIDENQGNMMYSNTYCSKAKTSQKKVVEVGGGIDILNKHHHDHPKLQLFRC